MIVVHNIYRDEPYRPPCSGALNRHVWKRALLSFSIIGFREMLRDSDEPKWVIGPLKDQGQEVYRQIVVDSPTTAEIKDCIDRFRILFPSFEEQEEQEEQDEWVQARCFDRYLGIRPLKLEVDLTSQCNLRCIMCYFVLARISKRKRFDLTAEQFEIMTEQNLP
ncbi:MAG: hypothetical protein ACI87O_000070 [Planctomycetota bacterium]